MAVGIDDVAAAASSEVSEVASSSTSVEILGDGLGEDSLGESLDDSIEMPFDSSEQQGIEGDGIGEDTSDAAESEQIIDVNGETEISGLDSINESIDNGITDVTPQIETNDDNLETDSRIDDSSASNENVEEIEKKTGGRYGDLKQEWDGQLWNNEPPKEVHHMPADSASNLERNDGPAIVMDYEDHLQTASRGSSNDAKEYRAKQKELIDQGKFREAMQMDIDDLHDKFGDKYDDQIKQMLDYVDELEKNGKI